MKISDLLRIIEEAAPFSLQEEYDNSGLQIGHPDQEISKALVCLDVTMEVLEEALAESCDVIVSHHPLIFGGLKKLTGESTTEQVVMKAVRHNLAILSVHTNLDNVDMGVNRMLAERLGLENLLVLDPKRGQLKKLVTFCPASHADTVRKALFDAGAGRIGDYDSCSYNIEGEGTFRAGALSNPFVGNRNELHVERETRIETIFPVYLQKRIIAELLRSHPYEEVAYDIYPLDNVFKKTGPGLFGTLKDAHEETGFLAMVKEALGTPVLRHSPFQGRKIKKVAVCGGSGSFLTGRAIAAGADAFITSEVKYNHFMDYMKPLLLIDAGHYETEQFSKELLAGIIQKKLINFAVLVSQVNTNPVHYF